MDNVQKAPLGEIFTRNFLVLATINLSMFFGFQMLNIGLPVYMTQLGAPGQIVGLATTLMTVTATLMRVFAGALLDRFGRWGMLIGGAVVMACAIVSFAIFPVVGIILGLRLLQGLGWGMGSTAASTIAADIIPKHRFAEGMGYFAMTTSVSSAIAPAASIAIVQGAGATYMIFVAAGITALALVLAIVEALTIKKKTTRRMELDATPAARGIPGTDKASVQVEVAPPREFSSALPQVEVAPPGELASVIGISKTPEAPVRNAEAAPTPSQVPEPSGQGVSVPASSHAGAPDGQGESAPAPRDANAYGGAGEPGGRVASTLATGNASASAPDRTSTPGGQGMPIPAPGRQSPHPQPRSKLESLFERRAVVPGILMLLVNVGFGCITTFIALHADAQEVNGASVYFIVYAVVTLASRPYIGKLIDRHGYRAPAILSTLCTAGTLALIGVSSDMVMFAVSGVLGGLGIGTAMGTFQSMAVASVEPWRRGVATSTYMTAFDLGIAIGAFIGGIISDSMGYTAMYFTVALFPVAACILSAAIVKKDVGAQSVNQRR